MKKHERFGVADKACDQKSYKKAYRLFSELASEGDTSGMNRLALMYCEGQYVQRQIKQAIYWDLEAVKQGSTSGLFNLALTYRQLGDIPRYKYYLEKAMALGDDSAAFELAKLYSITPNEYLQVEALLLLVVSRQNAAPAEIEEAKEILEKLKRKDKLGQSPRLFKPTKPLVKKIKFSANNQQVSKAVKKQLAKVTELVDCGRYKKARKLLQKLVGEGSSKAMDWMGTIYLYGLGVEVDSEQAINWYLKAIMFGCFDSHLHLAIAYRHTQHILQYKQCLEQAVAVGDDRAALLLAKLYNISDHEAERVEMLLARVVSSSMVNADSIYEANMMLKGLAYTFKKSV